MTKPWKLSSRACTAEAATAEQKRLAWLQEMVDFLRHELRDAMSGIQSSLDLLDNQNSDSRAGEYLARAQHSVTYMRQLLNDATEASSSGGELPHRNA